MRDTTIARNYAQVLFALGERHGEQAAMAAALDELVATLDAEPQVRRFLETPKVELTAKKGVVDEALRGRVPPLFLNFVHVVLERGRQRVLGEVAREYRTLADERAGRVHVRVTLAREPDERLEREIAADLSRILKKTVLPHVRVDPHILGGIVVRYGDRVLDGSLRRRLLSLRHRLLEADLSAVG